MNKFNHVWICWLAKANIKTDHMFVKLFILTTFTTLSLADGSVTCIVTHVGAQWRHSGTYSGVHIITTECPNGTQNQTCHYHILIVRKSDLLNISASIKSDKSAVVNINHFWWGVKSDQVWFSWKILIRYKYIMFNR